LGAGNIERKVIKLFYSNFDSDFKPEFPLILDKNQVRKQYNFNSIEAEFVRKSWRFFFPIFLSLLELIFENFSIKVEASKAKIWMFELVQLFQTEFYSL
jgi:hypothetical protein